MDSLLVPLGHYHLLVCRFFIVGAGKLHFRCPCLEAELLAPGVYDDYLVNKRD